MVLSVVHWLMRSKSKETVVPDGGRERKTKTGLGMLQGTENENTNGKEAESERTSLE